MQKVIENNNYHLKKITNKEKEAILRNPQNIIINNKKELRKYVLEAINNKNAKKNIYLGIIPINVILRIINEITDIKKYKINNLLDKTKHYDLVINQEEIRHLYKESLTEKDIINFINNLDNLILNFDSVRYGIYTNNQNALRFKKKIQGSNYIALEIISKQKGTIRTQTIFLEKKDFLAKKKKSFSIA